MKKKNYNTLPTAPSGGQEVEDPIVINRERIIKENKEWDYIPENYIPSYIGIEASRILFADCLDD